MGLNKLVEWLSAPLFIIAQTAPLAALIPILTFAYGIGLTSKVMTVCIMAMPVIVLNSLNAVRHTPASLLEMGRCFLGSRWQVILKIVLPSRSEEHTSELQSLMRISYAVFCLKKKNTHNKTH